MVPVVGAAVDMAAGAVVGVLAGVQAERIAATITAQTDPILSTFMRCSYGFLIRRLESVRIELAAGIV
jgi:hypothetical protein